MEKKKKKPGSGGARPNSGRKKKDGKFMNFKLATEVCKIIKSYPNGTAFVEAAVITHHHLINSTIEATLPENG